MTVHRLPPPVDPELAALNVHPIYNIERSGNLIERMTFNNVAANANCRLIRMTYQSHGRVLIQGLDDRLRPQGDPITLIRTNKGLFVHVVVEENDDEMVTDKTEADGNVRSEGQIPLHRSDTGEEERGG